MYEGFLLVALVVLVVLAIRPGKALKCDDPLVIHKPGFYHATLAPKLDRVQNLIEQTVGQLQAADDMATQYFKMTDVAGQYLLAVGCRAGIFYFQAILPALNDDAGTLRKFSEQVLVHIPLSQHVQSVEPLCAAIERAAHQLQIVCLRLP